MNNKDKLYKIIIAILVVILTIIIVALIIVTLLNRTSAKNEIEDEKTAKSAYDERFIDDDISDLYDTATFEAPSRIEIIDVISVNKIRANVFDPKGNALGEKIINVVGLESKGDMKGAYLLLAGGVFREKYHDYEGEFPERNADKKEYQFLEEDELKELVKENDDCWIEYAESYDSKDNEIDAYVWPTYPDLFTEDNFIDYSYNYNMVNEVYGLYFDDPVNNKYDECFVDTLQCKVENVKLHKVVVDKVLDGGRISVIGEDGGHAIILIGNKEFIVGTVEEENNPIQQQCYEYNLSNIQEGSEIFVELEDDIDEEIVVSSGLYYYQSNIWMKEDVTTSYDDFRNYCYTAKFVKDNNLSAEYNEGLKYSGYVKRLIGNY